MGTEDPSESPTVDPTEVPTYYPTEDPTYTELKWGVAAEREWMLIRPDYDGDDGALLWHVYYGEFSDDSRFDAFRRKQLVNADVIKPFFGAEELERLMRPNVDRKVEEQKLMAVPLSEDLAAEEETRTTHGGHSVLILLSIVVVAFLYGFWYKQTQLKSKVMVDPIETETLINRRQNLEAEYIEVH